MSASSSCSDFDLCESRESHENSENSENLKNYENSESMCLICEKPLVKFIDIGCHKLCSKHLIKKPYIINKKKCPVCGTNISNDCITQVRSCDPNIEKIKILKLKVTHPQCLRCKNWECKCFRKKKVNSVASNYPIIITTEIGKDEYLFDFVLSPRCAHSNPKMTDKNYTRGYINKQSFFHVAKSYSNDEDWTNMFFECNDIKIISLT